MKLSKRVAVLEKIASPVEQSRIVIRFVGPGSEDLTQPTEEEIRGGTTIMTVRFVEGKAGRPAEE